MLVAEQAFRVEHGRVLAERLAVHQQMLPVHVHLHVGDPAGAQRVDHVQRHADVAHQDLHRRLGVLVLEEQRHTALGAPSGDLADAVDEAGPDVRVGGLERVVVALDARPQDHLGADVAGEIGGVEPFLEGVPAHRVVGRREPALAVARIEMGARREGVDAVPRQGRADIVEVVPRELLRVVELVVVDVALEPGHRARHALRRRLACVLRLVAAGYEARDHRAERPDTETRPHASLPR